MAILQNHCTHTLRHQRPPRVLLGPSTEVRRAMHSRGARERVCCPSLLFPSLQTTYSFAIPARRTSTTPRPMRHTSRCTSRCAALLCAPVHLSVAWMGVPFKPWERSCLNIERWFVMSTCINSCQAHSVKRSWGYSDKDIEQWRLERRRSLAQSRVA
jgi:hypothetical protein